MNNWKHPIFAAVEEHIADISYTDKYILIEGYTNSDDSRDFSIMTRNNQNVCEGKRKDDTYFIMDNQRGENVFEKNDITEEKLQDIADDLEIEMAIWVKKEN